MCIPVGVGKESQVCMHSKHFRTKPASKSIVAVTVLYDTVCVCGVVCVCMLECSCVCLRVYLMA